MATHPSVLRVALFVSATLPLAAIPGRASLMTGVAGQPRCPGGGAIVTANVVALNQPLFFNRLGAGLPSGFIFALAGDVVSTAWATSGQSCWFDATNQQAKTLCQPGQVALRSARRPRPLVLRVNQGQCLQVTFTNLLASPPPPPNVTQTLQASVHVQGMEWLVDSRADGSFVGRNPNSIVPQTPAANKITYTLFARKEGDYLFYSTADAWSTPGGGGGDGGQLQAGLFGVVNVEPVGAQWFRSQVTAAELRLVTRQTAPDQHPLIDYYRLRPPSAVYDPSLATCGDAAGNPTQSCPVLDVLNCPGEATAGCPQGGEIVAGDLTAVISGRGPDGKPARFPKAQQGAPVFTPSYALPDRLQPYRELTIVYHEAFQAVQAFQALFNQVALNGVLNNGGDNFGINYGMGGIGAEILANRLGVGPEASCTSCKFEEFFLTSWAVGDPAMVVDKPASSCIDGSNQPIPGCKATRAFYPDDPSNVYHSYLSDHTKFRILHAGPDLHHLHHQHAQQWLHSPDSSDGEYDDSQVLGPGSAFTLEMVYNASGNVNQTAGDSIFHCHFYPHFAAGMWSLWRVHDVFEPGTQLDANGTPVHSLLPGGGVVTTTRALPDGEIVSGTPIPALVPLPTLPMAPMPAQVQLSHDGTVVEVCRPLAGGGIECTPNLTPGGTTAGWTNPGFPFFIPGLGGQRAPHPPLHFAHVKPGDPTSPPLNGGLPRHLIRGCALHGGCAAVPPLNYQDFSKTLVQVAAFELPEAGTRIEQVAMAAHAQRLIPSITPEGSATTVNGYDPSGPQRPAQFIFNGLGPRPGAPYADPCVSYSLQGGVPPGLKTRRYLAADIQIDATFNNEGWHFPQERITTLWGDVLDTISGQRPPEPFFFRADSGECIEYTLANLVPNVYELDDFQVRTPTDILGQHIHLVKFDVTASDGATNGFNYEDGTLAPNEVTERIRAINQGGGLAASFAGGSQKPLTASFIPFFGPGPGGEWVGAQATVSRWFADPLLDGTYQKPGVDRTLRTVFTHDHYGPSTHQQAGLYAGLVVEPKASDWYFNEGARAQGGPFGGVQPDGTPLRGPGRPVRGADGQLLDDGGPTTWQAVIQTTNPADSFREFMVEMQDSTLTYGQFTAPPPPSLAQGWCSDNAAACTPATASRPQSGCNAGAVCYGFGFCSDSPGTGCKLATWNAAEDVKGCAHSTATCNLVAGIPNPFSGIDSAYTPGGTCSAKNDQGILASCTQSSDCSGQCTGGTCSKTGNSCSGNADCHFGSSCNTQQATCNPPAAPAVAAPCPELITLTAATNSFSWNYRNEPLFPRLNSTPRLSPAADTANAYRSMPRGTFGAANLSGDPATPLMRAYAGDDVQVRTLVGAHINPHNLTIHDAKWLMEPAMIDSGWRTSQTMGISEHFEEIFRLPVWTAAMPWGGHQADYLFMAGAAAIEQAAGDWGLIRAYGETQSDLRALPQNQVPAAKANIPVCPALKPPFENRDYTVVALTARQALAGQALVYNSRAGIGPPASAAAVAPESAAAAKGSIAARASASPNPAAAAELLARTTPTTLLESGQPQARTGSRIGLSGRPQPLNLRTRLNFQSSQEAAGTAAQVMSDPSAILYFKLQDLNNGTPGTPCQPPYVQCHSNRSRPEPLVLRANAGDCITVHLINAINPDLVDQPGSSSPIDMPWCDGSQPPSQCHSRVSLEVGLHPQLVNYDVTRSDGFNAGFNPPQTAAPASSVTYTWYAGNVDTSVTPPAYIPVEFGAANLLPSDVFNHYQHALFGSLVIEPQGATGWQPADGIESRVRSGYAKFHEFVLSTQDGLNATNNGNGNLITLSLKGESVTAVNFRNENLHGGPRSCGTSGDFYCFLSNQATCCTQYDNQANCLASAPCGDPQTPILKACAGEQVRLRLLHGGGINTNEVFELYGHLWAETPYFTVNQNLQSCLPVTTHTNLWASTVIGDDHQCASFGVGADTQSTKYRLANQPYRLQDSLTEWQGSRGGHGPSNHFDVLLESAGGVNGIPGDYLFRTYTADHFRYGLWGLLRVEACPAITGEVAPAVPGAPAAAAGVGPASDRR